MGTFFYSIRLVPFLCLGLLAKAHAQFPPRLRPFPKHNPPPVRPRYSYRARHSLQDGRVCDTSRQRPHMTERLRKGNYSLLRNPPMSRLQPHAPTQRRRLAGEPAVSWHSAEIAHQRTPAVSKLMHIVLANNLRCSKSWRFFQRRFCFHCYERIQRGIHLLMRSRQLRVSSTGEISLCRNLGASSTIVSKRAVVVVGIPFPSGFGCENVDAIIPWQYEPGSRVAAPAARALSDIKRSRRLRQGIGGVASLSCVGFRTKRKGLAVQPSTMLELTTASSVSAIAHICGSLPKDRRILSGAGLPLEFQRSF